MSLVESEFRTNKRRFKYKVFGGIILSILITIGIFAVYKWSVNYDMHHSKRITTSIDILTKDEIRQLVSKNYKLAEKYNNRKTEWLYNQILHGSDNISLVDDYMYELKEFNKAKLKFYIASYIIDG